MTKPVQIDLPLVTIEKDGLWLAGALGFPQFSTAHVDRKTAITHVRRRVAKHLQVTATEGLVEGLIRGAVTHQRLVIDFDPPQRNLNWRDKVSIPFDMFVWPHRDSLLMVWVPAIGIQVVVATASELESLVAEQIRATVRRRDQWSLPALAGVPVTRLPASLDESPRWDGVMKTGRQAVRLVRSRLTVRMPTPSQLARRQQDEGDSEQATPTLKMVATRLRGERDRNLMTAYQRDNEVERLHQLLCGSAPRSVLLVGPSGVGKTAIFHQWVQTLGVGLPIWATDGSRLISGQSGFGMWQQQCLKLVEEAAFADAIVHLGDLIELCQSGKAWGSGGCGGLLATPIGEGRLRAVISCTAEQLALITRTEPRLVEALTELRLNEPSPDDCRTILLETATAWRERDVSAEVRARRRQRKTRLGTRASIDPRRRMMPTITPEGLEMLDRLHRRFPTDVALPGRSLSLFRSLMSEHARSLAKRPRSVSTPTEISEADVITAFGRQTGLPRFLIDDTVRPDLQAIEIQLKNQVIGQDAVLETITNVIAVVAADLTRGDRPMASLLMIGPTGVGKTETAKALARLIYSDVSRLVRIDLSEFGDAGAAARLIGDVTNPDGVLTAAVQAQPFSLVLLDEFEKAHPSVFDLLLQVLGEGRLTDSHGRVADFRGSIVMMTSNLGVETFQETPLGLNRDPSPLRYRHHFEKQLRSFLRPEMFNRIDEILTYHPLGRSDLAAITRQKIDLLHSRDGWMEKIQSLHVDDQVIERLIDAGNEPQYGARALNRVIEQQLVVPVARFLSQQKPESQQPGSARDKLRLAATWRHDRVHIDQAIVDSVSDGKTAQVAKQSTDHRLSIRKLALELEGLRRRSQKLHSCSAVRHLKNHEAMLTRRLDRLATDASTPKAKKQQEVRRNALQTEKSLLTKALTQIRQVARHIEDLEDEVLAAYYAATGILDVEEAQDRLEASRSNLFDVLCRLRPQQNRDSSQISLIISGKDLQVAEPLLSGYQIFASQQNFELQVHALLRCRKQDQELVINCDGWEQDPAFRVHLHDEPAEEDSLLDLFAKLDVTSSTWSKADESKQSTTVPPMVAYRSRALSSWMQPPAETMALMFTFCGPRANLLFSGEAGIHSFYAPGAKTSGGVEFKIETFHRPPAQYKAPSWLAKGDFQFDAAPRRMYDACEGLVQDLPPDQDARRVRMDRGAAWLVPMLEADAERRVWAVLEE